MVFSQLGIWKRSFYEQILSKKEQIWNAYVNLYSVTILQDHNQINYGKLIEHRIFKYIPSKPNKFTIFWKNNKFISPNKYQLIFSHKSNKFFILTKFNKTNLICSRNNIQPLLQNNKDDKYNSNTRALSFYGLRQKNHDNKHKLFSYFNENEYKSFYVISITNSLKIINISSFQNSTSTFSKLNWRKCEGLQETNDIFRYSSNCEYAKTIRYRGSSLGSRFQLHRILHQNNHNNFSSKSEGSNAQTNLESNNDEASRKLAKEVEEKAKREKIIKEDHEKTILQLEVLKAQVKKVREEMQAKKHEGWTIKIGKLANSIGSFIIKIGPTIRSILSLSRYANTSQLLF